MSSEAIQSSRAFFLEIVLPILRRKFPAQTAQMACGVFGWGSDAFGLDDELSRDHHGGLRIDALLPERVFRRRQTTIARVVSAQLPESFRGQLLREGHVAGKGLALESLESFLRRTIGLTRSPRTPIEWLQIPEEDIWHVVNGEVWHDPSGRFTAIRRALQNYYPEPVRLRRVAHWCRYFSGMGTYWLHRALLRGNEVFAAIAFGKTLQRGLQLAFLLDRQYFPYDKWLWAHFLKLPRLSRPLRPLAEEAVRLSTPWERKLVLLNTVADVLDETMVADGLIASHPKFLGSATSGYRLLEHAYAEITKKLPVEIKSVVPVWDQIYLEQFHTAYVDCLDRETWHSLLNLTPARDPSGPRSRH